VTTTTRSSLEHAIGPDGLLAIRLRDGELRLRGVDGDSVRVRDINGHDLDDMFAIDAAAGSLSLKPGRGLEIVIGPRSMRRGHGRHTPELEIDVPRGATLVVEVASGDVEVDGLVGDQRYRTASGDITLRAVSGSLSIEAVSGDIDITATGDADVTARSVSGDIGLRAARLSALQLTTTSGDLRISGQFVGDGPFSMETVSGDGLFAPAGDVRVEMTSVTGDLTSDLEGKQLSERGRRGFAVGSDGPVITFRSMSGDLHIVRPSRVEHMTAASHRPASQRPEPIAVAPPTGGPPVTNGAIAAAYDDARLGILRALERGEIDVAEAGLRLETLDAGDVGNPPNDLAQSATERTEDQRAHG
jgi:hypothetical protein